MPGQRLQDIRMRSIVRTRVVNMGDMKQWRQSLPIYPARKKLLIELRANNSCVIVGETGSGKTTQIPQVRMMASQYMYHNL